MTGGETDPTEPDYPVVSESPGAADFDIYETAYRQEIERIRADTLPGKEGKGSVPMVYLTRRVDGKDELMKLVRETTMSEPALGIGTKVAVPQDSGFRSAVSIIRTQLEQGRQGEERQQPQSQELGFLNVSETSDVETSASTQEGATASTATTGTEPLQSDGQRGRLRSLLTRAKLSRSP
jgi:[calcium/calmodulin-dependent protein kinase] kinase